MTASSTGITTKGAYQEFYKGGPNTSYVNSYLAKFSPSGKCSWSTYHGGGPINVQNLVAAGKTGIYISGTTKSDSNIATAGAYSTSRTGGYDVYLAKYSFAGIRLWETYYGGDNDEEFNLINVDDSENVYITGQTLSTSGIATPNAQQKTNAGLSDGYIAKFDSTGKIKWSTYLGGSADDRIMAITNDHSGNIYLSGSTYSNDNMSFNNTRDSSQGDFNCFLSFLTNNGKRTWATYLEGASTDATGLKIDDLQNLYIYGHAYRNNIKGTTGSVYQKTYSGFSDLFLAKLELNSLSGHITTSSKKALKSSKAYLCTYNSNDSVVKVIDSVLTDTSGYYSFILTDTTLDTVYIYAMPNTSYTNELPTWSDSGIVFQDGNKISLAKAGRNTKDFSTIAGTNTGGSGFIGGKVVYCTLCKTYGSGQPVAGLRLVLADSNGIARRTTYTDKNGNFSFSNISIDKYKVYVDRPHINDTIAPEVILTSSTSTLDKILFTLHPTYLEKSSVSGIQNAISANSVSMYPNPCHDKLYFEIEGRNKSGIITISDPAGKIYLSETLPLSTGLINISRLPNGVYFLNYKDNERSWNERFVKQ